MQSFLACICCCCYEPETPARQHPRKTKGQKKPKQNRLITKYKRQQFMLVDDQTRRKQRIKAYCCPICTLYYTKIIACSECVNFICYTCLEGYYKKNLENKVKMKCPFCNSATTIFIDYELQPHSYFDKTNKTNGGFLSKQQRMQLDSQIKRREQEAQRSEQQLQTAQNNDPRAQNNEIVEEAP